MIRFSHTENSWQVSWYGGDSYWTPFVDITVEEARSYFDKGYQLVNVVDTY